MGGEFSSFFYQNVLIDMTEQQQHLQSLLQQRLQLDSQISKNKELFWKVQGVIEYLTQIGVTLPEPKLEEVPVSETEVVE